jgi:hypothetical protein
MRAREATRLKISQRQVTARKGIDQTVARECILLEVLQRQKLVIPKWAIFTSFSTESVERSCLSKLMGGLLLRFLLVPLAH